MYNREELEKLTVRELRVLCRSHGIIVTIRSLKSELIKELLDYSDRFSPKEKNDNKNMSVRVKRIKEQNDGLE